MHSRRVGGVEIEDLPAEVFSRDRMRVNVCHS